MRTSEGSAGVRIRIHDAAGSGVSEFPFLPGGISAGFPSPAADFLEDRIDLNRHLIRHPATTFVAEVNGHSMTAAGIRHGDLLVIDRSVQPQDGMVAVCILDGEFVLKRLKRDAEGNLWLMPENPGFKPIPVTEFADFEVWGVVTWSVHRHH